MAVVIDQDQEKIDEIDKQAEAAHGDIERG